jgi:hypothetical protein
VTAGTAYRRVLLSSISGAAPTWVKIEHVLHEFSHLPGVREDILDIILNLRKLVFTVHVNRPVRHRGGRCRQPQDQRQHSDHRLHGFDPSSSRTVSTITPLRIALAQQLRHRHAEGLGEFALAAAPRPPRRPRRGKKPYNNLISGRSLRTALETPGIKETQQAVSGDGRE